MDDRSGRQRDTFPVFTLAGHCDAIHWIIEQSGLTVPDERAKKKLFHYVGATRITFNNQRSKTNLSGGRDIMCGYMQWVRASEKKCKG